MSSCAQCADRTNVGVAKKYRHDFIRKNSIPRPTCPEAAGRLCCTHASRPLMRAAYAPLVQARAGSCRLVHARARSCTCKAGSAVALFVRRISIRVGPSADVGCRVAMADDVRCWISSAKLREISPFVCRVMARAI
jgi:hypothetical protein